MLQIFTNKHKAYKMDLVQKSQSNLTEILLFFLHFFIQSCFFGLSTLMPMIFLNLCQYFALSFSQ